MSSLSWDESHRCGHLRDKSGDYTVLVHRILGDAPQSRANLRRQKKGHLFVFEWPHLRVTTSIHRPTPEQVVCYECLPVIGGVYAKSYDSTTLTTSR